MSFLKANLFVSYAYAKSKKFVNRRNSDPWYAVKFAPDEPYTKRKPSKLQRRQIAEMSEKAFVAVLDRRKRK